MYAGYRSLYRVFLRATWEAYVVHTYAIEKIRNLTWSKSPYVRMCSHTAMPADGHNRNKCSSAKYV